MYFLILALLAVFIFPVPVLGTVKNALMIPLDFGKRFALELIYQSLQASEKVSVAPDLPLLAKTKTFSEFYRLTALQDISEKDRAISECYYRELAVSMKNITYEKTPITSADLIDIIKSCDNTSPLPFSFTNPQDAQSTITRH